MRRGHSEDLDNVPNSAEAFFILSLWVLADRYFLCCYNIGVPLVV